MVARTPKSKGNPNKKIGSLVEKDEKTKGGRISKNNKPPMAKKTKENIKAARMALAEGKISTEEQKRKHAMDLRTLYIRFKKDQPEDEVGVREKLANHPEIKFVRIPRQSQANRKVRHAFVEFGSEAQCEEAKETLTKGPNAKDEIYVDFVGVKSKGGGKPSGDHVKKSKRPINPNRLFIAGLVDGLTEEKLKMLFPKCASAEVKGQQKGGKGFAFVQFSNPADAKAAFDASQKLNISGKTGTDGHHMTVVYARMGKAAVKAVSSAEKKSNKKSKGKAEKKAATDKGQPAGVKGESPGKEESPEGEEKEKEEEEDAESDGEKSDGANEEPEGEKEADIEKAEEGESENDGSDDDDDGDEEEGDEEMENDAESSGEEEEAEAS